MVTGFTRIVNLFKPKRRWAQFSLATMFLVVTAICVWLAAHVRAANRQRAAVAAIRAAGGDCYYDYELEVDDPFAEPAPPGPAWLRERLGIDHLASITTVYVRRHAQLARLLPHLCKLPKLATLEIEFNGQPPLSDADVAQVRRFTSLTKFSISAATETESLVAAAACLPHLETLEVWSGALSVNGLRQIGRMTALRSLSLSNTRFGDDGLTHIARLTGVAELDLEDTDITDAGLRQLRGLKSLRKLRLAFNEITDTGLKHVSALTELRELNIIETKVTDEGVAWLQAALPNCRVEIEGPW